MFYKSINLVIMILSVMWMEVGYCTKINSIESIFSEDISIEDKLEYLESIKNKPVSSFSRDDIWCLRDILYYNFSYLVDDIKIAALEILFREDLLNTLEKDQVILKSLANTIHREFKYNFFIKDFLPLKLLIMIDILADDSEYYSIGPIPDKWIDDRREIEKFIFRPLISREGMYKNSLYGYERYLLERIAYFDADNSFKKSFKEAFVESEYSDLKPLYIEAMFFLDMEDMLLEIISDRAMDTNLRKQAIKTSLKLLPFSKVFERFSKSFLDRIKEISNNSEENIDLKNLSNYILQSVNEKKLSLKNGNFSCSSLFV